MIKYSQITQSKKVVLSLQYHKKRNYELSSFFACRETSKFLQIDIVVFVEVARHVQSTRRKFAIFLQFIKKKVSQLLLCPIEMQNIHIFYGGPAISLVSQ